MPRPEKIRKTRCNPASYYFKPKDIPMSELEEIILASDELEAIRLADMDELFQENAAIKMNISRATFGRILMRAHKKIAEAIINGKAIRISENIDEAWLHPAPGGAVCGSTPAGPVSQLERGRAGPTARLARGPGLWPRGRRRRRRSHPGQRNLHGSPLAQRLVARPLRACFGPRTSAQAEWFEGASLGRSQTPLSHANRPLPKSGNSF